ncbi:MAG TPA: metalloregulator ArsR/SmtB family transcription factor [Actinomycetales bacterium]|nr:metalloregulator ArsR/SmtB family transcription factor [Actinomycetales bacterium]
MATAPTRRQADDVCADLHVLAEPHRLLIVRHLRRGARTAGFLADAIEISPSLASHHLGVLMEAGLVSRRQSGAFACYAVNRARLQEVHRQLGRFAGATGVPVDVQDSADDPCRT